MTGTGGATLPASGHAPSRNRAEWLVLGAALLLMPVDGFPAGAAVLREFGSRPVHFALATFIALELARALVTGRLPVPPVPPWARTIAAALALVFAANIGVATAGSLTLGPSPFRAPMSSWVAQAAMAQWMVIALVAWPLLFARLDVLGTGYERFLRLALVAAVVHALFYADAAITVARGDPLLPATELVARWFRPQDTIGRPHGLSTEPSLWGAWAAFAWPILFFVPARGVPARLRTWSRGVALALLVAGLAARARTLMVLLLAQLAVLCVVTYGYGAGPRERRRIFAFAFAIAGLVGGLLFDHLASVFDVAENLSSTHRLGSTIAAMRTFLEHPLLGVGLGQFGYYYADHLPQFAMISEESLQTAALTTGFRASTYNGFVRLGTEAGLVGFLPFAALYWLVLRPLRDRLRSAPEQTRALLLSLVGGAGFWMSQDSFGYQPALFATSLALYAVARRGVAAA